MENWKQVRRAYQKQEVEFAIVENIIKARVKNGLTQAKLAVKMQTKQSAISRLESGLYNPSLNFLQKLARALNSRLIIKLESI